MLTPAIVTCADTGVLLPAMDWNFAVLWLSLKECQLQSDLEDFWNGTPELTTLVSHESSDSLQLKWVVKNYMTNDVMSVHHLALRPEGVTSF